MFVGIVIISTLARFDFIYVKHDFLIELKRKKKLFVNTNLRYFWIDKNYQILLIRFIGGEKTPLAMSRLFSISESSLGHFRNNFRL